MNIASISADIATLCSRNRNISPARLQRKSGPVSRLLLSDFPLKTLLAFVVGEPFQVCRCWQLDGVEDTIS